MALDEAALETFGLSTLWVRRGASAERGAAADEALPELASAQEQGLADFEATYWNGFFLPKGTPAPIVQKLHDAAVATVDTAAVQARLKVFGLTEVAPDRRSPEYLTQFVTSEINKWHDPVKASGVSLD